MPRKITRSFFYPKSSRYFAAKRIQRKYRKYRKRRRKKSLYTKVKKLQRITYRNLQPGWVDDFTSGTAVGSSGFCTYSWCNMENIAAVGGQVAGVVQPANHQTRIGNKITVKKIRCKFLFEVAAGDRYNMVRVIIFSIPDPGATSAAPLDILALANVQSFYKKDSAVKFKIHKDFTVKLGQYRPAIGTASVIDINSHYYPSWVTRDVTVNFGKGLDVWYKNVNAGTPTKNQVGLLLISDSTNSIPTGHPTVQLITRVHFDP